MAQGKMALAVVAAMAASLHARLACLSSSSSNPRFVQYRPDALIARYVARSQTAKVRFDILCKLAPATVFPTFAPAQAQTTTNLLRPNRPWLACSRWK